MEFDTAANVSAAPIEKTLLGQTPLSRMIRFRLQPGQTLPVHAAPHWVHLVIVSGRGCFLTDQEISEAAIPGSYRIFAPQAPHGLLATTALEAIAVIVQGV